MVSGNYYAVDYYELIGASPTDSKAKLRIKVLKLWGELDVEIRTKIPQRIKGEAKEALKKKLGRDPTEYEERDYVYEKTEDPDTSKRDREHNEKNRKLALVGAAKEVLLSEGEVKRDDYDKIYGRQATCFDHHAIGGGIKWFDINSFGVKKLNSCYFCSQHCFDTYVRLNAPRKKGPNDNNVPCCICHKNQAFGWKKRRNGDLYCEDCYNAVPNCSWCKTKKVWDNNYSSEGKRFCSQHCFDKWNSEKNKSKGSSQPKTKPQYLTALTSLPGWESLTEDEKDKFKGMILSSNFESDWKKAITEAQKLISTKGQQNPPEEPDQPEEPDEGDNHQNLSTAIAQAIQEIETELNQESKIFLEKDEAWREYIKGSANLTELQKRKEELLKQVKLLKQQHHSQKTHNLTELRTQAINLIKLELTKNPPISTNELTNPNWENQINQASENTLAALRDKILAEIKSKRAQKQEVGQITELLAQAHQPEHWNNYQKLTALLQAIKKLRSSNAYQAKEAEIQALEKHLQALNPSEYEKTNAALLDQQIQNAGLTPADLDQATQAAIAEAKKNPTETNRKKAEEGITVCEAKKGLEAILKKATKAKTKPAKAALIMEILDFISKNQFTEQAYQLEKAKVDQLLAELRGESSSSTTPQKPSSLTPYLIPTLLVVGLLGLTMTILLLRRKKRMRRLGKSKRVRL